jgi:ABC-type glycerol-3-phosphate transport system substrate-binding protein
MAKLRFLIILVISLAVYVAPLSAQEERVLEVWTHEFPPLQDALTNQWIPEFEAAHPGWRVEYTAIPFAGVISYDTKLIADLSSGGGPDVWVMGSWNYTENEFIESGFLSSFDPQVFGYDSLDELVADYPPGSLDAFIRDGQIYGLFNELTTLALFYNLDMFDAAGIEYLPEDQPVSWQHIGEISQQLRQTDSSTGALSAIGYQFGFFANFRSPQWYAQNYYSFLRQYGQDDLFVDGQPAANTEAAINAFQMIYDFTYEYQAYDPTFLVNWFTEFPNNRVAMVLAGPWFAAAIRAENPDVRFGVAPAPVVDPEDPETFDNIVYNWGWSVNASSDAETQAMSQEFLAFLLGKNGDAEQPLYWFENIGLLQPRTALLESEGFADALEAEPWLRQFIDGFETFDTRYVQHSYDEVGAALIRAIDRIIYDQMSPEETAELLQRELERLQ